MQLVRRIAQALLAAVLVFGVWFGAHAYLWLRLVRDTGLGAPWSVLATALLAGLALVVFLAMARLMPKPLSRLVHDVSFHWMGLLLLLVTLVGLSDVAAVLVGAVAHPALPVALPHLQAAFVLGGAVVLGGLSMRNARGLPPVRRVSVALDKLPKGLDGLRIVQISDLHVDHGTERAEIERLVERVNALSPDLVALTGDLVDGTPAQLAERFAPLAGLRAKHGIFAVTGNHEYYSGADAWMGVWQASGFHVLHNDRVTLDVGGARLDVAGVPDWRAHGPRHAPRLADTLAGRDPTRPVVLLAHQPRQFTQAAELGVDLQLSGHTHGGQIWPFSALVRLVEPYFAGLVRKGTSQLYVSRGTGSWGPRMRLGAPRELTELTLVSS